MRRVLEVEVLGVQAAPGCPVTCAHLVAAGYKRLAVMRRGIRISALAQLVYICVRTLWHSIPFFTGGPPLPPAAAATARACCPCSGCHCPYHASHEAWGGSRLGQQRQLRVWVAATAVRSLPNAPLRSNTGSPSPLPPPPCLPSRPCLLHDCRAATSSSHPPTALQRTLWPAAPSTSFTRGWRCS